MSINCKHYRTSEAECGVCYPCIVIALRSEVTTLEAERDEWKARALRDPSQLATLTWRECYMQLAEVNQRHMAERDALKAELAAVSERLAHDTGQWLECIDRESALKAELARLGQLHPHCAAFDDQPGPCECRDLKAQRDMNSRAIIEQKSRVDSLKAELAALKDDFARVDDERLHQFGLAERLKAQVEHLELTRALAHALAEELTEALKESNHD